MKMHLPVKGIPTFNDYRRFSRGSPHDVAGRWLIVGLPGGRPSKRRYTIQTDKVPSLLTHLSTMSPAAEISFFLGPNIVPR
jgi:hypothetical protein